MEGDRYSVGNRSISFKSGGNDGNNSNNINQSNSGSSDRERNIVLMVVAECNGDRIL